MVDIKAMDIKDKTQRIIAYSGTHGTGKTTAVFNMAAALKREFPEKTVGVVMEVAAHSPYPINQDTTEKSQMWIFTYQIQKELQLLSQYDLVVSDRTALDSVAYTYVMGYTAMAMDMFKVFAHHAKVYKKIMFREVKRNNWLVDDGVRDAKDLRYREAVEATLYWMYSRLGITKQDRFKII